MRILAFTLTALLTPLMVGAQDIKVTLLGTGSPEPLVERFGPATMVEAGNEKLLFDAGRGVSQRLWQLHQPLRAVTALFITHLHSDHVIGIPDLWLTGWTAPPYGQRQTPLRVFGPRGTREMMTHLREAYAEDIRIRMEDERLPESGMAIEATDVQDGVIYERSGVKVTVFTVDHGPAVRPALGYRVDYAGHSVVLVGDTRYTENVIRAAQNTDLLIYPMAMAAAGSPMEPTVKIHFTTPEDAGRIFSQAHARMVVYNHIILLGTPQPTLEEILSRTRTTYAGPLQIGEDLLHIDIGAAIDTYRR
jgi:ribonuclease Z